MGNEAVATKAAELFSFNGKYSIPDENSAGTLLDDASTQRPAMTRRSRPLLKRTKSGQARDVT